ncbi:hypothetical protein Slin14017_G118290 [Septoria linicola]|nr:hypothetical protein Slin14017_G118290 [Septoria linicola]
MAALSFNDLPAAAQHPLESAGTRGPAQSSITKSREHVRLKDSFFSIFPANDDDPNTTFLDTIIHFFNAVGFDLYSNRPTEDLVALYWARHILPKRAAATNTPLHHIWGTWRELSVIGTLQAFISMLIHTHTSTNFPEYHKTRGEKGNPPENNNNITAIFSDQAYLQTEICGFDGAGS